MGRDDLYITVPSFFRCPISLDVMKSPVSLCTGVTYDRSSIQRWLDGGNNTCPATMQVLSSTDLIPNLTLQRLIRIWSDSAQPAPLPPTPPPPPPPPVDSPLSSDGALALVKSLSSSSNLETSLSRLAGFAAESEDNSVFLAKIDGCADLLLNLTSRADGSVNSMELIVRVLEPVLAKSEDRNSTIDLAFNRNIRCLSSLQLVIERGTVESKIASIKILESISITEESKLVIAEMEGFLHQLLKQICSETEQDLIESTLSLLIHVAGPKRVKPRLLALGAVKALSELLAAPSSAVSVTEKALRLLETVSSCREGREALFSDERCLEAVLQRAFKVSAVATEQAVVILWGLCCCAAGDERVRAVVGRCNGVARLLVVMQSGCTPAVRRMCGELLRVFRVSSRSQPCLSNYETKTTHIMPF